MTPLVKWISGIAAAVIASTITIAATSVDWDANWLATRGYVNQRYAMNEQQFTGLRVELLKRDLRAIKSDTKRLTRGREKLQELLSSATTPREREALQRELDRTTQDLESKAEEEIDLKSTINRLER